jgi:hypothetical protein
LSGVAGAVLGWTPDTFWNATPHDFWAVHDVRKDMSKGG